MVPAYATQRRTPRIASESPVLVRKIGGNGLGKFARAADLGLGGIGLIHREGLGEGTHLQLLISVRGHLIEARGRVCYEIPAGVCETRVGVEFLELSPPDRRVLECLVAAPAVR